VPEADIRTHVRELVYDLAPMRPTEQEHSRDQRLVLDLDFDSLGLLELAAALEQEIGTPTISEAEATGVQTVGDVEDLVVRLLAGTRTSDGA
jgi:acyl carrier protein